MSTILCLLESTGEIYRQSDSRIAYRFVVSLVKDRKTRQEFSCRVLFIDD
nr:MAG TPA: hypothetical protein [Caudoviricetes sp.]